MIITIALYGTRMAHIFIRVCTLIYNGVLPSTFARHLGHQYLPQPGRGMLYGLDCSGRVARKRNKHAD